MLETSSVDKIQKYECVHTQCTCNYVTVAQITQSKLKGCQHNFFFFTKHAHGHMDESAILVLIKTQHFVSLQQILAFYIM